MGSYNLKNIFLGIGMGLIIASVINLSEGKRELSEQEIKLAAQKYNLIVLNANELINKEKDNPSAENRTQSTKAKINKDDVQAIEIVIKKGDSSEVIAELLFSNHIIEDKNAFLNYLRKSGKESKLQYGIFYLPSNAEFGDIVEILTTIKK